MDCSATLCSNMDFCRLPEQLSNRVGGGLCNINELRHVKHPTFPTNVKLLIDRQFQIVLSQICVFLFHLNKE